MFAVPQKVAPFEQNPAGRVPVKVTLAWKSGCADAAPVNAGLSATTSAGNTIRRRVNHPNFRLAGFVNIRSLLILALRHDAARAHEAQAASLAIAWHRSPVLGGVSNFAHYLNLPFN